jgi:hypothetical protein
LRGAARVSVKIVGGKCEHGYNEEQTGGEFAFFLHKGVHDVPRNVHASNRKTRN